MLGRELGHVNANIDTSDVSPIAPSATREVEFIFDPSTTGTRSANLTITTDDTDEPTVNVSLVGTAFLNVEEWKRY